MNKPFFKKKATLLSIYALVFAFIVAFDQITKYIALNNKDWSDTKFIPYILNLTYHRNLGAAWGILDDNRWIFIVISLVAVGIIPYFIYKYCDIPMFALSLSMIVAGGVGNLIDRIFFADGVVDFLDFAFFEFPVFNVADSFVCIGAALMMVYLIFFDKVIIVDDKKKKKQNENTENNAKQ